MWDSSVLDQRTKALQFGKDEAGDCHKAKNRVRDVADSSKVYVNNHLQLQHTHASQQLHQFITHANIVFPRNLDSLCCREKKQFQGVVICGNPM
jgi:hypothetical protein